jgi:phosphoribosylformylglycinamidine synthase
MPYQLEITLKPGLFDAAGAALGHSARDYFGIRLERVQTVQIVTIDAALSPQQIETVRTEIFTNPVTQVSSLAPLPLTFDWCLWVGLRPGVRDNAGATAVEAIEDVLGIRLQPGEAVYTSRRWCLGGAAVSETDARRIAEELLANDIIQRWRLFSAAQWDPALGVGITIPRVQLDHAPAVATIPIDSDGLLREVSDRRNLALNPNDIPAIRAYFQRAAVQAQRAALGLCEPTDIELETISQARSDHCNHNTFRGLFHYRDTAGGPRQTIDNLFKTYIEAPTLELQRRKPWVVSVLWDNAGVGRFDDEHLYVITGETHNSPSNMEAYGGAITGIVGVYRDPLGTGKGARLVMGGYGFCVGPRDYAGELRPRLHPRRLLDGVIEGVRDGGNKSGIPTTFGQVLFHPGYLGKCLVYVTAIGIMPAHVQGEPAEQKRTSPGDLILMCGGRVGKDGIHGVTASSESFSAHTPAGHVQIGDPYTQKKMHDFLLEARDEGLIAFITDNGGGGLSSSIGESARFAGGARVELERVPLKYAGLDPWEIWVSESQERMTVAVRPGQVERFLELSRQHAVESTVIGSYTNSGRIEIAHGGKICAAIDLDLFSSGFPQWEFEAEWLPPEQRGLCEPVLGEPRQWDATLLEMLARPNICSREWITRQYDHEVQGGSVLKPLVGRTRDIPGDAAVTRPVLGSNRALAFAQALLPQYSAIDTYHMTACVIDEAVRRLIAVGGSTDHIGGVDNFCWPGIQYHPETNPDGKYKAAQLVRSCQALRDMCLAYGIPLLSGKDSMYVDGHLPGRYGETHKVSAQPSLQFAAIGVVEEIGACVSMESKLPGDLVYLLGVTRDELGGSEYYERFGYVGRHVPQVDAAANLTLYRRLARAISAGLVASAHGIYRGGLGVHLALVAMGGGLGMAIDLGCVPVQGVSRDSRILFSESAGRFLVTVDPERQAAFEACMAAQPMACLGVVTSDPEISIRGRSGRELLRLPLADVKRAWQSPFDQRV